MSVLTPVSLTKRRQLTFPHQSSKPETDYELVKLIEEDTFTETYSAYHLPTNRRHTIVKVLKISWIGTEQNQRFLNEASILGRLSHPNIIPVYDFGITSQDQPFYTIETISGVPWSKVIHAQSLKKNLGYWKRIADALIYTHTRGVVHLDVNPQNVLLGQQGQLVLGRWQCATLLEGEESKQTESTPGYMPPEIAKGEPPQVQSDIYLLGAILFEILTGKPPHPGKTEMERLSNALENKIQPTQSKHPLMEVAYHALAREPEARYASVLEFKETLKAGLEYEESLELMEKAHVLLDQAQQSRKFDDFAKAMFEYEKAVELWPENQEAVMGLNATVRTYAQCALERDNLSLAISLLDKNDIRHQDLWWKIRDAQTKKELKEKRSLWIARLAAGLGVLMTLIVGMAYLQITTEKQKVDAEREKVLAAQQNEAQQREKVERLNYLTQITLAKVNIDQENTVEGREQLQQTLPHLRNWEYGHLQKRSDLSLLTWPAQRSEVSALVVSRDGKTLLTASPSEPEIITGSANGVVKFWHAQHNTARSHWKPHAEGLAALIPRTDGAFLVTGGWKGELSLWDTTQVFVAPPWSSTLEPQTPMLWTQPGTDSVVEALAFAASGRRLVVGKANGVLEVYQPTTLEQKNYVLKHTFQPPATKFLSVAGHPIHLEIAIGTPGEVIILDLATGKAVQRLQKQSGAIHAVAYNRDGSLLLTGGTASKLLPPDPESSVRVWSLPHGKVLLTLDYNAEVNSVAWSPNGQRLLTTSSEDQTARLWDAATGQLQNVFQGHKEGVSQAVFHPNGQRVVTAGKDEKIKLWDVITGKEILTLEVPSGIATPLAFTADGLTLFTADWDGTVWFFSAEDWTLSETLATSTMGPSTSVTTATSSTTEMGATAEVNSTPSVSSAMAMSSAPAMTASDGTMKPAEELESYGPQAFEAEVGLENHAEPPIVMRWDRFFPYGLPPLLTLLTAMFLASLTIQTRRNNRENQLFTLLCIVQVFYSGDLALRILLVSPDIVLTVIRLDHLIFIFSVPLSVHFFQTVLRIPHHRWFKYLCYGVSTVLLFFTQSPLYMASVQETFFGFTSQMGVLLQVYSVWAVGVLGTYMGLLMRAVRHTSDEAYRRKLRFIQWGAGVSILLSIGNILPAQGWPIYPPGNFGFLPLILMAYGLLRHQVLDTTQSWFLERIPAIALQHRWTPIIRGGVWLGYALVILVAWWALHPLSWQYLLGRLHPYGWPPLLSFVLSSFLMVLVLRRTQQQEFVIFSGIMLLASVLSLNQLFNGVLADASVALQVSRWLHLVLVFLPALILQFIFQVTRSLEQRLWVPLAYAGSAILTLFTQTPLYFTEMQPFLWGFRAQTGGAFLGMCGFVGMLLVVGGVRLYRLSQQTEDPWERRRFNYLLWGLISWGALVLGSIPAWSGWDVYPLGHFLFLPLGLWGYGLFRSNLREVIQMVRTGLFWLGMFGVLATGVLLLQKTNMQGWGVSASLIGVLAFILFYEKVYGVLGRVLSLFVTPHKEQLDEAFEELTLQLSQAKSIQAIYQSLMNTCFEHLTSLRFSFLVIPSSESMTWHGWQTQNLQSMTWGQETDSAPSAEAVHVDSPHPLFPLLVKQPSVLDQEQIERWLFRQKQSLAHQDIFKMATKVQSIFFEKSLMGVLLFGPKTDGSIYTKAEIEFMHQVGLNLGPYIENAQLMGGLETRIAERTQEIERIQDLIRTVNSTLDLDRIMILVMAELEEMFSFEQLLIHQVHSDGSLRLVTGYGVLSPEQITQLQSLKIDLAQSGSLWTDVVSQKKPVHLPEIQSHWLERMDERDQQWHGIVPFQSLLIYPMEIQGKVIGTITITHVSQMFVLTEAALLRIGQYLAQVATAINNARLANEAQRHLSRLHQVHQISQKVSQHLDLQTGTQVFIEEAVKAIRPDGSGSILLYHPEDNTLQFYASYGLDPDYVSSYEIPVHPNTMYTYHCFHEQRTQVFEAEDLIDFRDRQTLVLHYGRPTVQQMVVPLISQNVSVGLVNLSHYDPRQPFTEGDQQMLENITLALGHHFENSRLYQDLKTTKMQLLESEKVAALTQTFEKFVPTQFLTRIADQGLENIELGRAHTDSISILFSDIRSFTTLSEQLSPQELLNFLNEYFKRMNRPLHANHGFIDKFIGDAIMALFDSPEGNDSDEAEDALWAAIGMQQALYDYNEHLLNDGWTEPIQIGIGIHSGPVIIGTLGSEDRMDSTVLGDNVNLASRLEGLTKTYGAMIIISTDTFALLRDSSLFQYRELDFVKVKGKTEPVGIYEIYDADTPKVRELKRRTVPHMTVGITMRRAQLWDQAVEAFEEALAIFPEDRATQLHLKRIEQLRTQDLPSGWDGAIALDSK